MANTISIWGAKKEALTNRESDTNRRDNAKNILNPDQIQGKAWRTTKVLTTTLGLNPGEEPRPITKQDLITFSRNIKALEDKVEKGVTANEVISLSTTVDKKRSRQQIHMAVPAFMKAGDIHFITNAGPDSKRNRHHVQVILSDYEKGLAKGTSLQAAKEIAHGNIKIDCDCEHHTFVFRYITTLMGANAGRAETGFPKLRNPRLEGIACKHTLRVMIELNTSIFVWKRIAVMIEADRNKNADKTRKNLQKSVRLTKKEANELAAKQDNNRRVIKEHLKSAQSHKRQKTASDMETDKAIELLAKKFKKTPEQVLAMLQNHQ